MEAVFSSETLIYKPNQKIAWRKNSEDHCINIKLFPNVEHKNYLTQIKIIKSFAGMRVVKTVAMYEFKFG
jgi:hypothetical protein